MATSLEYIRYVLEQIDKKYAVRFKKMFGEYMIYANEKPILLVCDNCVFVKKLEALKDIMADSETGIPYEGAKEHYILDFENEPLFKSVVEILESITPLPKKRRSKNV